MRFNILPFFHSYALKKRDRLSAASFPFKTKNYGNKKGIT